MGYETTGGGGKGCHRNLPKNAITLRVELSFGTPPTPKLLARRPADPSRRNGGMRQTNALLHMQLDSSAGGAVRLNSSIPDRTLLVERLESRR
jgi:hypothetical protein